MTDMTRTMQDLSGPYSAHGPAPLAYALRGFADRPGR